MAVWLAPDAIARAAFGPGGRLRAFARPPKSRARQGHLCPGLLGCVDQARRADFIGHRARQAARHGGLVHAGPGFLAILANEEDLIVRPAHHIAGDIIGKDPVAALALALGFGVGAHVMGFGGKADDEAGAVFPLARERGEDIGVFGQVQRGRRLSRARLQLQLAGRRCRRTPVGHRRHRDEHIGRRNGWRDSAPGPGAHGWGRR